MARFSVNFYSYSLDHGVDIEVTIPSFSSCDRDPARKWTHALPAKFPVLYLLHGHGNDRHSWMRYTSVGAPGGGTAHCACDVGFTE